LFAFSFPTIPLLRACPPIKRKEKKRKEREADIYSGSVRHPPHQRKREKKERKKERKKKGTVWQERERA